MDFNVEEIAKLARIKVTEAEVRELEKSINEIIVMLEKLNEADLNIKESEKSGDILLEGLLPMDFREDEESESMSNEELLSNAPESVAGCIIVPRTIE